MAIRKIFQKEAMQIYMNLRYFLFYFFVSHCERKKFYILIHFATGDFF